jgi:predicted enzyme related to lactoylglutathione lyase
MGNTFDWIEIRTGDIEKTADFYENLFGWEVMRKETTEGLDYWIFDTGDKPRIENIRRGAYWLRPAGEDHGIVVYIVVDDIEAVLRKVISLGGEVLVPKTLQGPAFRAYFTDPDGNCIGLWEERSPD